MKMLVIAIAAAAALGAAAPAGAQYYGGVAAQLGGRIQNDAQRGIISPWQTRYLYSKLQQLAQEERRSAYRRYDPELNRTIGARAWSIERTLRRYEAKNSYYHYRGRRY